MAKHTITFTVLMTFFYSAILLSQTLPHTINYQGVLKDASGVVVTNGDYNITFKLYDVETSGTELWSETKLINVADGIINTHLGSSAPINLPFSEQYWLGITVSSGSELTPRIKLSSVPYSFMAMNVMDESITTSKIADGTITAEDIGSNQIIKKVNGIRDSINLVAGSNITITPGGNNITISAAGGGSGTISGSGNANYIPVFTDDFTLGNSEIYQSGGNIGIGTTNPTAKMTVFGGDALINGLTIGKGANNINTNSAFGFHSLYSSTTGYHNAAFGYASLLSNQTGNFNVAAGVYSLRYNTEGGLNAAFGYATLSNNTIGGGNTALGSISLVSNISGSSNTAVGNGSLWSNVNNNGSTALGYNAMYYADDRATGRETGNTAVGFSALRGTTVAADNTGQFNTAIGSQSLYINSSGYDNTAVGFKSLFYNSNGINNVAVGSNSLFDNTYGSSNTVIGVNSAKKNTAGNYNTAIGVYSLAENITGSFNTAVGFDAGAYRETVNYGTFLGYWSYASASDLTNVMGLGYNSRPTGSNQVRIGNSSVTSIGGYAGWTNFSDGRYKTSIQENVMGLEFIMKLRPVTYQLDINRLSADLNEGQGRDENGNISAVSTEMEIRSRNEKSQKTYTGFIAQEVEKAAKETGYEFSGVDAPKNENDYYGLRYAEFVVPLVKAVQEQQKIIEELKARIQTLENK